MEENILIYEGPNQGERPKGKRPRKKEGNNIIFKIIIEDGIQILKQNLLVSQMENEENNTKKDVLLQKSENDLTKSKNPEKETIVINNWTKCNI